MPKKNADEQRRNAYEHTLASIRAVYEVLFQCFEEVRDADLDAARNTRDLNLILNWSHDAVEQIYKEVPELAPPPREPPLRRWPADPTKPRREYGRRDALSQVKHQLDLVRMILREAAPFADQIGLKAEIEQRLAEIQPVYDAAVLETWKGLSDSGKRERIRDWGLPRGAIEPPPADRDAALTRLNEKLETATQLLGDAAGLVVDTELGGGHLSGIASCLAMLSGIQQQIYAERPDLIPQFLRESYDLRNREAKAKNKKK